MATVLMEDEINAERRKLWQNLQAEAQAHFPGRLAAKRYLAFVDRQFGFLSDLEARQRRFASSQSAAWLAWLASKDGRVDRLDPMWAPLWNSALDDVAAEIRLGKGQPLRSALGTRYAQLLRAEQSHACKAASRRFLGLKSTGRYHATQFQRSILEGVALRYREIRGVLPGYVNDDPKDPRDKGRAVRLLKRTMNWIFFPHAGPSDTAIVKCLKGLRHGNTRPRRDVLKGRVGLIQAYRHLESVESDFKAYYAATGEGLALLKAVRAAQRVCQPIVTAIQASKSRGSRRS